MEEERYLGGWSSANLRIQGRGPISLGYGVYATTKRIIGVKSAKLLGGMFGIAGLVAAADRDEFSSKTFAELLAQKDIEVNKQDIFEIEVKRPRSIMVGKWGHLSITLNSGGRIVVAIADKKLFEKIMNLMMAFYPERVKVVGEDFSPGPMQTSSLAQYSAPPPSQLPGQYAGQQTFQQQPLACRPNPPYSEMENKPPLSQGPNRFCDSCGNSIEAGARFCGICGRPLP